jgi:hypothetical protein
MLAARTFMITVFWDRKGELMVDFIPIVPALDDCGAVIGMNEWQGKAKYLEKIRSSATLSPTHPT